VTLTVNGDDADGEKLTAAAEIAYLFGARFTGLPEALRLAREAGNAIEKKLTIKLAEFGTPTPTEIRRLDVFSEEITDVLARECRTAMSTYHGPLKAIPSSGA